MKRIVRILGLAMLLTALLVVSIAGAVFAANGNGPNGHGDGTGDGPLGEGPFEPGPYGNGDCTGDGPLGEGPFEPGPNGPNGAQYQYGKVVPE